MSNWTFLNSVRNIFLIELLAQFHYRTPLAMNFVRVTEFKTLLRQWCHNTYIYINLYHYQSISFTVDTKEQQGQARLNRCGYFDEQILQPFYLKIAFYWGWVVNHICDLTTRYSLTFNSICYRYEIFQLKKPFSNITFSLFLA